MGFLHDSYRTRRGTWLNERDEDDGSKKKVTGD